MKAPVHMAGMLVEDMETMEDLLNQRGVVYDLLLIRPAIDIVRAARSLAHAATNVADPKARGRYLKLSDSAMEAIKVIRDRVATKRLDALEGREKLEKISSLLFSVQHKALRGDEDLQDRLLVL